MSFILIPETKDVVSAHTLYINKDSKLEAILLINWLTASLLGFVITHIEIFAWDQIMIIL